MTNAPPTTKSTPYVALLLTTLITALLWATPPTSADTSSSSANVPKTHTRQEPTALLNQPTNQPTNANRLETEPPGLVLVEQSSSVPANGEFVAKVDASNLSGVPPEAQIEIQIFTILDSVSALDDIPAKPLNRLPPRSFETAVDVDGQFEVVFPTRNSTNGDANSVLLPDAGVYPILITIESEDEQLWSLRTNLVRLPAAETDDPQQPVESDPDLTDAPTVTMMLDVTEAGFSVERATTLLTANSEQPLTVVLDGTSLSRLAQEAPLLRSFLEALDGRPIHIDSAQGVDVSALVAIGQTRLLRERFERLHNLADSLSIPTDRTTIFSPSSPTAEATEALLDLGVTSLVNPNPKRDEDSAPEIPNFGEIQVTEKVLYTGSPLSLPDRPANISAVNWMHRVRAATELHHATVDEPSIVMLTSENADDLRPTHLDILLEDDHLLPTPLSEAVKGVDNPMEPATDVGTDLSANSDEIKDLVSQIDAFSSIFVDGTISPDQRTDELFAALRPQTPENDRTLALQSLRTAVQQSLRQLNFPDDQAVTVAAQSLTVPIAIENRSDGIRRVLLRSNSDKVQVDQDNEVLQIPPGKSFITLEVSVRSLGVSPVQISLFTPDGKTRLASTRFEVRSTAIPGIGVLLCLAFALLLAFWWYVHAKRRREDGSQGANQTTVAAPSPGQVTDVDYSISADVDESEPTTIHDGYPQDDSKPADQHSKPPDDVGPPAKSTTSVDRPSNSNLT